jgi:hypothetical protein
MTELIEAAYNATYDGLIWKVKRFRPGKRAWDETLVYAHQSAGMTRDEVIQYAIKRGSWA